MPEPIHVCIFTGNQNPDQTKEPILPNLDFWIFHIKIKGKDTYVEVPHGQYQKMNSFIKRCDHFQLVETYMAIYGSDSDDMFTKFNNECINFIELNILAHECFQEQKH